MESHTRSSKQRLFNGNRWTVPARGRAWGFLLIGLASVALSSVASGQCTDNCDANHDNTYEGFDALPSDSGEQNTAFGAFTLTNNTTGNLNTAFGADVLVENTSGEADSAFGAYSLSNNTTGNDNTAVGSAALSNNTTGSSNTSVGFDALDGTANNPFLTGNSNTAEGSMAMTLASGTASFNTALGAQAMEKTTNDGNTAVGFEALFSNTSGYHNTSTGSYSSFSITTGSYNTADGSGALFNNTTGSNNTASGNAALFTTSTGGNNIGVGYDAGFNLTTGSNNIDIGNTGTAAESNTIRIGTTQTVTFVAGVNGVVVAGGQPVVVSSSGQLGVTGSSKRFKEAIQSMDDQSESILALRPVSFRYKKELDPKGAPQFGLIAEEVAQVDPNLVVTDEAGKPFSVRYGEVNAMLLNEFLKEHRRVVDQAKLNEQQTATINEHSATINEHSATINELRQALAQQLNQIKSLGSGLQKVNDQLEIAHPDARFVSDH